MPDWFKFLWYEGTYLSSFLTFTLGWSLRIEGQRHIPLHGPVLVVANHQSFFDPLLIGLSTRRHLSFVARKSLFKNRMFTWVIDCLNAIPLDQDGVGKEGIRAILAQLHEGRGVAIYPEGERTANGAISPLKPGIGLLVKRVQAPIVPLGIAGAHGAWPRHQLLPVPAPLALPATDKTIAVSVSPALDGRRFAHMPRAQILEELYLELQQAYKNAEKLRRQ